MDICSFQDKSPMRPSDFARDQANEQQQKQQPIDGSRLGSEWYRACLSGVDARLLASEFWTVASGFWFASLGCACASYASLQLQHCRAAAVRRCYTMGMGIFFRCREKC
uniref:Uncharacterized protein n=1 Tax=Anopheles culicifacies TaxID=139723 RepID=A0A182MMF9_9DIPT